MSKPAAAKHFGWHPYDPFTLTCEILRKTDTLIIDVRLPFEFNEGHAKDAVNIPLYSLKTRLNELKSIDKDMVICCDSRGRSYHACNYLKRHGLTRIFHGGSWIVVDIIKNISP